LKPLLRAAALGAAALCAAGPASRAKPEFSREEVRAWRAAHEGAIVAELAGLMKLPNVAAAGSDMESNAERVRAILEERGVATELLRVEGAPPAVLGELRAPGAGRTVVFYAHYDGQPVDPKQWAGDPWRPVLRDRPLETGGSEIPWERVATPGARFDPEWRLYGRSASDDRAPIVGWMAALDALQAAGLARTVNLKFFLEGEEEAGSPHLEKILDRYADRLRGDLWLLCDGPVHQSRRMQVFFGARGVTDVEMTVYGPTRRLHSGHYGNWAPNPAAALVSILASLRDDEGYPRVPHFSDAVRLLSAEESRALAEVPDVGDAMMRELEIARTEGKGERLAEAIQRPAINIRGIRAGDVGSAATNSIPTEAAASIDFRLVPDQTPEGVRSAVEAHLRSLGYTIVSEPPDGEARRAHPKIARLRWGAGYPGYRTPLDRPVSRAVVAAVEAGSGGPVVRLPSLGGSIPMYLFAEKLGAPVIGIPIANHDNNQHAANENLRLQNLWDGIEIYAALFARLGQLWH
jgi:acetylornithine deacetylase/succinyl-diaminopimelate desuccinylase-like protein